MKVVILCGGRGTRMGHDTDVIPKPMVHIGGRPILWHIMKIYSHYGFNEFILCLGYQGYLIKEYFSHYFLHMNDVTLDLANNEMQVHTKTSDPWKVTLVDTGLKSMTGGRIRRIRQFVQDEPFMLTYGDGLGNINIRKLVETHKKHKRLATVTGVQSSGRFGVLNIGKGDKVKSFLEKPTGEGSWVNAGFFVLGPEVFTYLGNGDASVWEKKPLERLSQDGELGVYPHTGFWKCMDTSRERIALDQLWEEKKAPWKVWK